MSIVIICFLLAAYAVQSGGMLRTDVIVSMFGGAASPSPISLSGCSVRRSFVLIVWGSIEPALHAWTSNEFEGEGALRVPVWPARYVVMLGSALVIAIYLGQALLARSALAAPGRSAACPGLPRTDRDASDVRP